MTDNPIAIVVLGLAALVSLAGGAFGMAAAIKTLFSRPRIDPDKEFVTRDELRTAVVDIERKIGSLKDELLGRIEKQDDYARKTAHETSGTLNTLMLKVQTLLVLAGVKPKPDATGVAMADVDK